MKQYLLLLVVTILWTATLSAQTATTTWSKNSTPNMPCFSSAHTAYLNADTILDIVIGGGYELEYRDKAVNAYDGATGEILWQQDSRGQFFGSAVFQDITGDGIDDVFINGRVAQLNAYNGSTGELLWEFYPDDTTSPSDSGWYNFYNMQWVPDQDGDGILDILAPNGGDHLAAVFDTLNRPIGRLVVISGGTGAMIAYAEVPDGRETYFSPLVHDFENDGILDVIYGTGGETLYGNLWRTTLADILMGDLSGSILLAHSAPKGFIPPPTLADVNTDGKLDILIGGYNGLIRAIDGVTNQTIWQVQLPETETNASPTIGQFTDDFIPDMFISVLTGSAPSFTKSIQLMINGETGTVEWQDTLGFLNFATANAVDTDNDGKDEVILSLNYAGTGFSHELVLIDFNNPSITSITGVKPSTNLASTPWVGDLDHDGLLDIVYTHNQVSNNFAPINGYVIERLQTNYPAPEQVAFGSYMGTGYTGKYDNPYCQNFGVNVSTTASPCADTAGGAIALNILGGISPYIVTHNGVPSPPLSATTFNFQNLSPNNYDISIIDNEGCKLNRTVTVGSPPSLVLTLQLTQPSSATATDGAIEAVASGGVAPYQLQINGNSFSSLPSGTYTVSMTDANGCTLSQTAVLGSVGIITPHTTGATIAISPNPANNGWVTVQLDDMPTGTLPAQITLFDLNGRSVWQQSYQANAPNNAAASSTAENTWIATLDLRAIPQGIYVLQVIVGQGAYTTKLVR